MNNAEREKVVKIKGDLKRTICALHYIGADIYEPKIVKLINNFVMSKNDAKYHYTPNDLTSNNVLIYHYKSKYSLDFMNALNKFLDSTETLYYYTRLENVKNFLNEFINKDISRNILKAFVLPTKFDKMLNDIIGRGITFNSQNYKDIKSSWVTIEYNLSFLQDLKSILDVNETNIYNPLIKGEIQVRLNDRTINIIRTHLRSNNHLPKNMQNEFKNLKDIFASIPKIDRHKETKKIFIVDTAVKGLKINGYYHRKTHNLQAYLNSNCEDKKNEDVFVTDKYDTLNLSFPEKYSHYLVDAENNIKYYYKSTFIEDDIHWKIENVR